MQKRAIVTTGLLTVMAAVFSLQAQMNFSSFLSRSVRMGYNVSTTVDSLLIDTKVNSGLATTRIAMVVHPGGYQSYIYSSATGTYTYGTYETPVDSIEMSLNFTLPTDFVADSMWLWVNGKPVEAYIQDRALASSQYQQIVGTRRDPAILSYSGSGYYNLRIFPASTNVSRTISIQFHHTFDDDSISAVGKELMTAVVPIIYDTAYSYNYTMYQRKPLSYCRVTCSAGDTKSYSFSMPGLGAGQFSRAKSLELSAKDLWKLQRGTIAGDDPSGVGGEYLWVGRDKKSTGLTAGFTTVLSDKSLTFQPEPATRIIVIDMRNSIWNWNNYYKVQAAASGSTYSSYYYYSDVAIMERAKKYAILALQSYVDRDQSFNVIIAGKKMQRVFSSPVRGTSDKKKTAIAAILAARPDSAANTFDALADAVRQAAEGVTILISDLTAPPDYTLYSGSAWTTSSVGKKYDTTLLHLDSLVKSVPAHTLFVINDDWKFGDIALKSGGYVIGGLRNTFSIPYTYSIVAGKRVMELSMTPLFGSSNPTGLTRQQVSSADLDDIVYTIEGFGTGFTGATLLRVAGRTTIEKFKNSMVFGIAGKLGGLCFTRNLTASTDYLPLFSSYRPDEDVQWAWRESEWLASSDFQTNAPAIKAIGKEYHIVTQQTSLLALEPGMMLWVDTLNQTNPATITPVWSANTSSLVVQDAMALRTMDIATVRIGGAPYSNYMYGNGFNIDSIPMETISGVGILPIFGGKLSGNKTIQLVSVAGRKMVVQLPTDQKGRVSASLYSLTGRLVAAQTIDVSQCAEGSRLIWDLNKETGVTARGQYVLRVAMGNMEQTFRVPVMGR